MFFSAHLLNISSSTPETAAPATSPTETTQAVSPTPETATTSPTEITQAASATQEPASVAATPSSVSKDFERLQRNHACPGCDLTGANLADAKLEGIDLTITP